MQTKKKPGFLGGFGPDRTRNHLIFLILTVVGCGAAFLYERSAMITDIIALGTAYVSLILLVVTLSIGPLNLLLKRRNAVNLDIRRDAGIWAGITGIIHAFFSLQLYNNGDILSYFLSKQGNEYKPQFNLSIFSNFTGLIATIILVILLILSNNISLRLLKGKTWKFIQRFNYPLIILAVVHTIGYQVLNQRENFFTFLIAALVIFTVEAQLVGIVLTLTRERKREQAARVGAALATQSVVSAGEQQQNIIARRRFLILSGFTIVSGASSIVALSAALANQNKTNSNLQSAVASSNTTSPTTNTDTSNTGTSSTPSDTADTTNTASSDTPATTGTASASSNNSSNQGNIGTVLATLSNLPTGACTTFTTPDSGDSAFLIHEQDGSVKAFSNICTHRPYQLEYQQSQQQFYCPLHGAAFDVNTGQVTAGPARYGLSSFKVQVDSQGKITYIQS